MHNKSVITLKDEEKKIFVKILCRLFNVRNIVYECDSEMTGLSV